MSGFEFVPVNKRKADSQAQEEEDAGFEFVPAQQDVPPGDGFEFTPVSADKKSSIWAPALKTVESIGQVYPVVETAANLASQAVALPVAGLSGLGALATNAIGITDTDPVDLVHQVGSSLTYSPKTELGQHLTGTVMIPFEKLAETGQWAGSKTLDATGSPVAATAVDTAINMLPMAVVPAARGTKAAAKKFTNRRTSDESTTGSADAVNARRDQENRVQPEDAESSAAGAGSHEAARYGFTPIGDVAKGFVPLEEAANVQRNPSIPAGAQRVAGNDPALHGTEATGMEVLRREGDQGLPGVDGELPAVPPGRGASTNATPLAGQAGHGGELRTNELRMDDTPTPDAAARVLPESVYPRTDDGSGGSWSTDRSGASNSGAPNAGWTADREPALRETVPQVEMADAQRRDTAAPGMGAADRTSQSASVVPDQQRHAAGEGLDAAPVPQSKAARYALIEADDLKASHDTNLRPVTENPFGRQGATRQEHETAVQGIVKDFDPAKLTDALDDAGGAPIVARDGVVEAGQRRAIAIQRVYGANGQKAENYRQHLRENAGRLGLDPAAIDQMKRPVLVRIPDEPTPRFADEYHRAFAESSKEHARVRDSGMTIDPAAFDALSPESKDVMQFMRDHADNPAAIREFSQRVKSAMAEPDVAENVMAKGAADGAMGSLQPRGNVNGEALSMAATTGPETLNAWAPGMNYVPLVDDARLPAGKATTVADLPAPIRRENIIKDFAKGIGTSIYEGRVKGKKLGFFRPGVDEVRIKRTADIEVAAHEVAHLIDHRVPEISNAWRNDKALREELKSVSYDQKSVSEGFAEGVRLFLTQPDVLEARAPKVHAWLESFTQNYEYGPALRKAQEQMTGWFGQDALNRARSKIGTDKPLAEYFDGFWDKFRQSTVDDLHGIYRMEQDMSGKIEPNGPYESARLSRASASIADGAVRFGYPVKKPDGSFAWKGRGLEGILKPVANSLDDALLYFVGKSSSELMGQGREHLFSKGEIDGMLGLRTPEREKAFQDYQEWNKGILDFAEAQGVINPESRRLWQRTQYLPFHRVEQPGGLKGKPGEWQGIQALTGGTTNIKDVLGNMIGNAAMLLDKAVKNEARLKVAKLSQQEGGGKFMVKIESGERMVKIGGDQVLNAMLKKYGIALDGDAPAFFEFLIKGQPPAGSNVVAVMQNGKPVWFEVGDPVLYRALSAIDRPVQSEVVRWLGLPKRIGQATITLTPDFWMANVARDTLMGSVMSRSGFRPIIDSLQGMRLRMTSDPIYKDYIANGGGLSSIYLDEAALRTKLEKFYGRQGIDYRTVLDAPSKMLHFVETLGDAFEMSTRLGEYKRAIERGENPRHAAYQGREVSTDFAMRGDSKALGFLYDAVMFLRPAVVSWDRLYRGLAHDPNKGAIAAKAGAIALASAGLYLLNRDDPRYQDLPDWDRDANWHFFVGDQHFRYPKIWEIGALSSAAERTVERTLEENPENLGKDFARILGATFNLNLMPQIVAPLYEQATNRNRFTKSPIETPGQENVQPFLRSKPGTSETMKALGMATGDMPESMQVNPARAEALVRGYFNTWAMYGLMLSDQALFGDRLAAKRTDELPVVRRFYANDPAKHTKYEGQFYDLLEESKRLRGTLKELDDLGRSDWADQKEQNPLSGEARPLERAAKNLGVINKDAEAVRRSDATPAEKRQRLDTLTVERNALLKDAVLESRKAQKQKPMTPADIARQGVLQR